MTNYRQAMQKNGRGASQQKEKVPTVDDVRQMQRKLKDQAEESLRLRGGRSIRELVKGANRPRHLRARQR